MEVVMETVPIPGQRFLQPVEIFVASFRTSIFLAAFSLSVVLWLSGVLHDRYDFIVVMAVMTLGLLLSRVSSVKFFGMEIGTDPWMQAIQAQMMHRQLFPELYPPTPNPDASPSP
jgi:hypothetical protein